MTSNIITIENEAKRLGCEVIINAELKQYTTFNIGGKAPLLVKINNEESCGSLISLADSLDVPYYVFGRGSNLIVDDDGVNAVIFLMGTDFSNISLSDCEITCDAGVSLSKVCICALENELSGLEFAYGIPGTVGGAVYMNAGAYGGEIKDVLKSVRTVDKSGKSKVYMANEMDLSYRHSVFMSNSEVIVSAVFRLKHGCKKDIKAAMDELMERRRSKQPLEFASAGSTFKRPEGSYASLLIDQCGLKGMSVGDAEVSTKHCGFIVNKGNASFGELMRLITQVRKIVSDKTGYVLECEPEIISDKEEYRK